MSEWKEYKLGDIASFKTGKLNSNAAVINGLYPFFTCSPETLRINDYAFDQEAVLLAGNNAEGNFNIKYYTGKFNAYQRTYVISGNEGVDNKFLYYALTICLKHFKAYSQGTATKFLTAVILKNFSIIIPESLILQRHIASILSSLDDKIAVNKKICENLEAQAQALFKHWFVDFAPFKDGKFVESELGLIPEGWRVGTLGDIAEFKRGKTITKSDVKEGLIPVVAGGLEPAYYHNLSNTSSRVITISGSGANAGFTRMYYQPVWASDCSFVDNAATQFLHTAYCYLLTNKKNVDALQWGAAQPHVYAKDINKLPLAIAPLDVLNQFEGMVSGMFDLIDINDKEIIRLTSLRDTLLPKLMSGQIKV